MKIRSLFLLLSLASVAMAQSIPTMKRIEGGTRILGGGYQYAVKGYCMEMLTPDSVWNQLNAHNGVIGEIPAENNIERQVTVATFFLSESEVSNAQYFSFLMDSLLSPAERQELERRLKAAAKEQSDGYRSLLQPLVAEAGAVGLLPDTSCWVNDFVYAYNAPLVRHYLFHPAFESYPVVGVSWEQAQAYCGWLTNEVNQARSAKGLEVLPAFRLPTEAEWEYAAKGPVPTKGGQLGADELPRVEYGWGSNDLLDSKAHYMGNIKTAPGNYIGDQYEYTAPTRSFYPNGFGLYNMSGNVAEWCADAFVLNTKRGMVGDAPQRRTPPIQWDLATEGSGTEVGTSFEGSRVVKGGSWAEYSYGVQTGSRTYWNQGRGSSRIGFRVAMIKAGCQCTTKGKCKHEPF